MHNYEKLDTLEQIENRILHDIEGCFCISKKEMPKGKFSTGYIHYYNDFTYASENNKKIKDKIDSNIKHLIVGNT